MKRTPRYGLKQLAPDKDFKLGNIRRLPSITSIPPQLILGYPTIYDQKTSDFCAGAASAAATELQENEPISFEWLFAAAKKISGDPLDSFGVDLRSICKVHTKLGALPRSKAPFSVDTHPVDFLRDIRNWPADLLNYAASNRKETYFKVTGPYDHFDNMRATMYLTKAAVIFGVNFGWPLEQVEIDTPATNGEGHAMCAIGYTDNYMIARNSLGGDVGDKANHYIHRDVINSNIDTYGAFVLLDMPREDVEWHIDNSIYMEDPWYTALFKVIKTICGSTF